MKLIRRARNQGDEQDRHASTEVGVRPADIEQAEQALSTAKPLRGRAKRKAHKQQEQARKALDKRLKQARSASGRQMKQARAAAAKSVEQVRQAASAPGSAGEETGRVTEQQRRPWLLKRLDPRLTVDVLTVLLAIVFFAVAWPTLHLTHAVPAAVQPLFAALAAFPVLLLRINPALGWAISAGSALLIALAIPHQPGNDMPFQVVQVVCLNFLLFGVAMRATPQIVGLVWAATSLLFATTMAGGDLAGSSWTWPISLAAVVLLALLVRWLVQSRQQLLRKEEENEVERARRAILEEKARIARDLHDVVAHHMSLVVVQAQTAPYRVEGVTPEARAEFESIGATAREALNEIRGMLGVLRSDGQMPETTPQPKAADVLSLFDGARRAGVDITWTVDGELAVVPDTTGLALFRIVQESLSNASRHAPGAPVQVRIVIGLEVHLTVANGPGATAARPVGNGGHGIAGMRARALAVGGQITADPRQDGGFQVVARLPLSSVTGETFATDAAPGPAVASS
ncbi:histidine kinase [Nocardia sp. NPDC052566]|uniref:histidine kinase n=1 Tax=Nocardia sp. NPDC052566 TaxID=3364330 RepID=UPI0037C78366